MYKSKVLKIEERLFKRDLFHFYEINTCMGYFIKTVYALKMKRSKK